jgi:archaemetzincin
MTRNAHAQEEGNEARSGAAGAVARSAADKITLRPSSSLDLELAAALRGRLEGLFGLACEVSVCAGEDDGDKESEPAAPRDPATIAGALPSMADGKKLLVLTRLQLTSATGSPVWGAAELGGRRALLSLRPFGIPDGPPQHWRHVFRQVLREAAHELGHLFGLEHCATVGCIMQVRPARVDDTTRVRFCGACEERLHPDPPAASCRQDQG